MARLIQPLPDADIFRTNDAAEPPRGLIVQLGESPRDDWRWWSVEGEVLAAEHRFTPGHDAPWGDVDGARVVALVPATRAPVRIAPRGDMPGAQALAAARLDPPGLRGSLAESHVATGLSADGAYVLCCVVARQDMDIWLGELAAAGIDADALVPAPLVLSQAPAGKVLVGEIGGQFIARTADAAFAGEPELLSALGGEVEEVSAQALADGLAATWADPSLDLRQGQYARPRVSFLRLPDWGQLARMAAIAVLLGFLILAVETVKLNLDASSREDAALAAARERFPGAGDLASAEAQIDAELLRRGAGGASFGDVAPAVFAAMQPLPSLQLRSLGWEDDGTLAIRAAAPRVEDLNTMLIALQRDGWQITVPPETAPDATGATIADITVRVP